MNTYEENQVFECSFALIDLKNTIFKLVDGTAVTPNEIEIKIGAGNLTYTEHKAREYFNDRGKLDEVRDGEEQPVDVTFNFKWDYIKGTATTVSIEDALKQIGFASTWESSDTVDACRPYALDIIIENTPQCDATDSIETITLSDFRYEELSHDASGATVACTGKCNVLTATSVRSTPA